MATNVEIAAKVAEAESLALTPAQMVALCDRANGDYLSGRPMSYQIANRSFTFHSISQVMQLREFYSKAPAVGARQFICQSAEF